MADIEVYTHNPEHYEILQFKRPDYKAGIGSFVSLSTKYLKHGFNIADFCSGTGSNSKLISKEFGGLGEVLLIDINKDFLEIGSKSDIKARQVRVLQSDILKAHFDKKYDAVIAMFAYHHVKDSDKAIFIQQIKSALKSEGVVILGEIYSPDRATVLRYYEELYKSVPEKDKGEELKTFLKQTAESDDFEFKVSRAFAHNQLKNAGFNLIESERVWNGNGFGDDVGMFIEVWKLRQS
jgi:ubiquinone/menaquinone biosynthesis C-methylase UbiE